MPRELQRRVDPADLAHCHGVLARGSKTFAAAATVLPRRVREPAALLYAFCRVADDLIDDAGADPSAALVALRSRVDAIYAGTPGDDPVDRGLSVVVSGGGVPRALFDALLEGFGWDAVGRRYTTLEEVHAYAARVAGTVGAMMAVLMGRREPAVLARACDLGVAMQLTNIARDVGEDAARGRIYLPTEWIQDAGLDCDEWLAKPVPDPRIAAVVSRMLVAADALYERADDGVAMLPADCRFAIRAARLLYADIGRYVARAGMHAVTRRSVVPGWRKVWLLLSALRTPRIKDYASDPPLDATRFLVAACEDLA